MTGRDPAAGRNGTVSLDAVAAAVALLTASLRDVPVAQAELTAGTDPAAVTSILTAISAGLLAAMPGDGGGALLRDLGEYAVTGRLPDRIAAP